MFFLNSNVPLIMIAHGTWLGRPPYALDGALQRRHTLLSPCNIRKTTESFAQRKRDVRRENRARVIARRSGKLRACCDWRFYAEPDPRRFDKWHVPKFYWRGFSRQKIKQCLNYAILTWIHRIRLRLRARFGNLFSGSRQALEIETTVASSYEMTLTCSKWRMKYLGLKDLDESIEIYTSGKAINWDTLLNTTYHMFEV